MDVLPAVDGLHAWVHTTPHINLSDHIKWVDDLIVLEVALENVDGVVFEILDILGDALSGNLARKRCLFGSISRQRRGTSEVLHRTRPPLGAS